MNTDLNLFQIQNYMKNMIKKKNICRDVLAEAKKSSSFERFSKDADVRIRFASEVFNSRREKDISQAELAKRIYSTQKVISKIESGDTNVGIELVNRIAGELDFNYENFCKIFDCDMVISFESKTQHSAVCSEMAVVSPFRSINILSYNSN